MSQEPFRFQDLPGELRLAIYDQFTFPGVQSARFSSPIGMTLLQWMKRESQRPMLSQHYYQIHADTRRSQKVPAKGFYTDDIIALGRQFGFEFDHRIKHRWFALAEPIWDIDCVCIFTYRSDDMAGTKGFLRYLSVPRTFQTAASVIRVRVKMYMDEKLMEMPWAELDDEESDISAEMIDAHSEMMLEIGEQHRHLSHDMTLWNRPIVGTGGETELKVAIHCYSCAIPEGGSDTRDGASLWPRSDLVAYGNIFPEGTRYYPVPAATIRRCIDDLCSMIWERSGTCDVYLDGELCFLGEEDFRPNIELPEGRTINDISVTYIY